MTPRSSPVFSFSFLPGGGDGILPRYTIDTKCIAGGSRVDGGINTAQQLTVPDLASRGSSGIDTSLTARFRDDLHRVDAHISLTHGEAPINRVPFRSGRDVALWLYCGEPDWYPASETGQRWAHDDGNLLWEHRSPKHMFPTGGVVSDEEPEDVVEPEAPSPFGKIFRSPEGTRSFEHIPDTPTETRPVDQEPSSSPTSSVFSRVFRPR